MLDGKGEVVGVVVAGVPGSGVNFAIPAGETRRFAYRPDFRFLLPSLGRDTMHRPALFKVRVSSPVPPPRPLDLELTLAAAATAPTPRRKPART